MLSDILVSFWYPPRHILPIAEKVASPAASCNAGLAGHSFTFPLWLLPPNSSALCNVAFGVGSWCWSSYYFCCVQIFYLLLLQWHTVNSPQVIWTSAILPLIPEYLTSQYSLRCLSTQWRIGEVSLLYFSTVHTEVLWYTVGWDCSQVPLSMMLNLTASGKMFLSVDGCPIICWKRG